MKIKMKKCGKRRKFLNDIKIYLTSYNRIEIAAMPVISLVIYLIFSFTGDFLTKQLMQHMIFYTVIFALIFFIRQKSKFNIRADARFADILDLLLRYAAKIGAPGIILYALAYAEPKNFVISAGMLIFALICFIITIAFFRENIKNIV